MRTIRRAQQRQQASIQRQRIRPIFLRNADQTLQTALYHSQSNGAVERLNRLLQEGVRAARAQHRPFDKAIRSFLANYRSTVHSPIWKPPPELMFGRRLRMPLDFLRRDPSERHVTFNFDEPARDSSIELRDKSEQF